MESYTKINPETLLEISHLLTKYASRKRAFNKLNGRLETAMDINDFVDVMRTEEKLEGIKSTLNQLEEQIKSKSTTKIIIE